MTDDRLDHLATKSFIVKVGSVALTIVVGMIIAMTLFGEKLQALPGVVSIHREDVARSARLLCAPKYPEDFAMQAACRRNFEDGAASIEDIAQRHGNAPAMQRALRACLARYTRSALTDFAIAGGCARNQEQGFLQMQR